MTERCEYCGGHLVADSAGKCRNCAAPAPIQLAPVQTYEPVAISYPCHFTTEPQLPVYLLGRRRR